ncbi:MAG: bifunctional (p)ppGpp synthetase/guanosine-3',5'-bis(diphosphate) 3'-pyrophosphohydrolase, partial [Firmicutes bacterium]|nr:bifunctional (p)ppGpp synthetase/guanosine-3',5'-bis(diphosphate) 3'-pyrophosphohydrolase [Bacillota bacterium]
YKKMTFQQKTLDEIFDLTAVRIIVDSVKDCYGVLGAVHTRWKPIPGRFKDYIAMPKPNNYQSLHTTVIGDNGNPFEIQIRTVEMHRIAEYGIAAHWKYKEGIKSDDEETKLAWLRQTLEWQQEVSDSKDFVDTLKMDLFSNQVFVFTPKGDVMELPAGSTPLDFAFKIHTAIGYKCTGAKVNGRMVTIDYELKNGEIVDIVTSAASKGPSIDWLKIVKTNSAKNKIRQYLKKENKNGNADKGKDMLEKAVRKKNLDVKEVLKTQYLSRAAKSMSYNSIDDLYNAVSYGGAVLTKTVKLCADFYREDIQAALKEQEELLNKTEEKKPVKKRPTSKGVKVMGVSNLQVRFAGCCNPIPGDEIIGYTTKGRGVSIHRADCVNLQSLPEEEKARFIEVSWDEADLGMTFDARINIVAEDRKGLMADISKICEDMDINISSVNMKRDKTGIATVELVLALTSTRDIQKVMARFMQIKSVVDVYRTS